MLSRTAIPQPPGEIGQRLERLVVNPHRAIRRQMMTIEVQRSPIVGMEAFSALAQRAFDVDVQDIASAGDQLAEKIRQIGLGLRVGHGVELLTVRSIENIGPAVTRRGWPIDQDRRTDNDYLALFCGQPLDGLGNLALK